MNGLRPIDRQVLALVRNARHGGARSYHVALGLTPTRTARYARACLLRLEREGLVRRSDRFSAVNDIFWEAN